MTSSAIYTGFELSTETLRRVLAECFPQRSITIPNGSVDTVAVGQESWRAMYFQIVSPPGAGDPSGVTQLRRRDDSTQRPFGAPKATILVTYSDRSPLERLNGESGADLVDEILARALVEYAWQSCLSVATALRALGPVAALRNGPATAGDRSAPTRAGQSTPVEAERTGEVADHPTLTGSETSAARFGFRHGRVKARGSASRSIEVRIPRDVGV